MAIVIKEELIINAEEEYVPVVESKVTSYQFCALCLRECPKSGSGSFVFDHQNSAPFCDSVRELFGIEFYLQNFVICKTCWKMVQMVGDFRLCCFRAQSWIERSDGGFKSEDEWLSEEMVQMIDCLQASIEDHMERIEQNEPIEGEVFESVLAGQIKGQAKVAEVTPVNLKEYDRRGDFGEGDLILGMPSDDLSFELLESKNSSKTDNNSKNELLCEICDIKFTRCDNLKKHMLSKKHKRNLRTLDEIAAQEKVPMELEESDGKDELSELDPQEDDLLEEQSAEKAETYVEMGTQEVDSSRIDLTCRICDLAFSRWANLARHKLTRQHQLLAKESGCMEEVLPDIEYPTCEICNLTFGRGDYFQKHLQTKGHLQLEAQLEKNGVEGNVHLENTTIAESLPHQTISEPSITEQKPLSNDQEASPKGTSLNEHTCKFCSSSFPSRDLMMAHARKRHAGRMPQCKSYCKKRFLNKKQLATHEKNCRAPSLKCSACQIMFCSRKSLWNHNRSMHTKETFKCKYCRKQVKTKFNLKRHIKLYHSKEDRKHACTLCEKAFRKARILEFHMLTHSGVRPHKCEQCDKGFIYKTGLSRHVRKCH